MDSSGSERMKPVPIADYLDHIGRAAGEKRRRRAARARRFAAQPAELARRPAGAAAGVRRAWRTLAAAAIRKAKRRTSARVLGAQAHSARAPAGSASATARASKAEEIAGRLAEAYARGREEGLVEGRAEAADGMPPSSPRAASRR